MRVYFITSLVLVFFCSCSEQPDPTLKTPQTPEALSEEGADFLGSYNKRKYGNIIEQLYDEALTENDELAELNREIHDISQSSVDNLSSYNRFINNNNNYWNALFDYSNQLNDTLIKQELNQLITELKSKYEDKMTPFKKVAIDIESRKKSLADHEIMMKVFITAPMMHRYQMNEVPDVRTLESVKIAYDSLIKDIQVFAQFKK